ncbi:hypothetical protein [Microvirga calopogonii]|uniref:hypothetical protein n=1 Tax=Microvirga calopogonii TaxID=2078013 RepID=UPI000E0D091F|nr:hypothetical protein [Microvirga calopogonii]
MPIKNTNKTAALEAMARLLAGTPLRAADSMLVDRNLATESEVSRATLARSAPVMKTWRNLKKQAVESALTTLRLQLADDPKRRLTDADLLREARVDAAALARMAPDLLQAWDDLKRATPGRPPRRNATYDPESAIASLTAKLYALTLAVRQRDQTIADLRSEIRQLKGQ